jgi:hypothetical protein
VIERPWEDDFAKARNEVLGECEDAWWVLSIDADERVVPVDVDALRQRLATAVDDPGGISIPLRDVDGKDRRVSTDAMRRVFPSSGRFVGRIHETPMQANGTSYNWMLDEGVELIHLGYRQEVLAARDKGRRNVAIARAQLADTGDGVGRYQLARSLRIGNSGPVLEPEPLRLYRELESAANGDSNDLNPRAVTDVLVTLGRHHAALGELDLAWGLAERALVLSPNDRPALALHADTGTRLGLFREVVTREWGEADLAFDAYDRPWVGAEHVVSVAKAHLGLEDVDAARELVLELLATPIPYGFEGWLDLVSLVAIVAPERADELLLDSAVQARDGGASSAVVRTFHPEDAAEFATRVALTTGRDGDGTELKASVALAAAVVADRSDLVEDLLEAGIVPFAYVLRMASHARSTGRSEIAAALQATSGGPLSGF